MLGLHVATMCQTTNATANLKWHSRDQQAQAQLSPPVVGIRGYDRQQKRWLQVTPCLALSASPRSTTIASTKLRTQLSLNWSESGRWETKSRAVEVPDPGARPQPSLSLARLTMWAMWRTRRRQKPSWPSSR